MRYSVAFTREDGGLGYRLIGVGTARLPLGQLSPLAHVPDRIPYRVYTDLDDLQIIRHTPARPACLSRPFTPGAEIVDIRRARRS